MEKKVKKGKGMPLSTAVLIGSAAIVLTLVGGFVLLWFAVIKPDRDARRNAEATAEPTSVVQPSPASEQTPTDDPAVAVIETPASTAELPGIATAEPVTTQTEEPVKNQTADPTEAPTPEPTEAPTPTPTEIPTPKPTPTPQPTKVPDSFTFGGKTVKRGTKKIDGSKLGINGKSSKLRHITAEEVANLVALCPDLEELSLDYCYMDDYEPLGELVKLKTLKLRRCNEGGKGNAVTDIDWVEDLTALTYLHFGHNAISDLRPLEKLKKLTKLNLSYNDLDNEDLESVGELTTLEELSLYGLSKISDVSPLASLSKLTYLHLGYNKKLKNIKPLTSLGKLKSLRINKSNISDVSYFKNFKALQKLDISGCPILFHDYYKLEDCKKLKLIVLDQNDTDASLAIDDMINNGFGVEILYEWP
ncbi:MAG: leucine-rich repeat domain-containing protein [Clostridia bacterium]|nr:leucine-rich repeat domain-containing protein [Clostridia bacterium]